METQEKIYINAYSAISAQDSFYKNWEIQPASSSAFLDTLEPTYKNFLPKKQLRRMSRVVRMGLATALQAIEQAGNIELDAIISGTAWGCVQNTEKFLEALIVNEEQYLTPTAFVQSTHNTVAGQIALFCPTNGYNMTYVQGKISFESALVDALTLLHQNAAKTVLVNGIDELTSNLKILLERLKCAQTSQTMGEGAACFILSNAASASSCARLIGTSSAYLSKKQDVNTISQQLLLQANCQPTSIDLLLCGQAIKAQHPVFVQAECRSYTHLCGNYPTNAAFALGLAVEVLQGNTNVKQLLQLENNLPKRIGIYNQAGRHQGLIVVEKLED